MGQDFFRGGRVLHPLVPDAPPRGPQANKELAFLLRGLGVRNYEDLLVMSHTADPYYAGRKATVVQAEWFRGSLASVRL